MKSIRLSVVIIAKDEEEMIGDCLESVKWTEEIVVVVDERTRDKTAEIAKRYTSKVFVNKFDNFGQQCQFALKKTTGDWVLKIDADERVTPRLQEEISEKLHSNEFDAYHAYFRLVFLGKEFRKSNVRVEGTIRLFRREKGKFKSAEIHEKLTVKGKVGILENEILHLSCRTIHQTLAKFNYFSSLEAEELYRHGGRTNFFSILLAPAHIFWRRFFLEKNYRNGMYGLANVLICAHYYLAKHLKIWGIMQREK